MVCEIGREKLDAFLDGELTPAEAAAMSVHLRACSACALDALARVQGKRAVAAAGKRYEPGTQLRARVAKNLTTKPRSQTSWFWKIVFVPAILLVIISLAFNLYVSRATARRQTILGELADLHVAALASATPVDVLSADRHTVKPWFQGRIPFTFNLPELQGSEFTLLGGRVTYLAQTPGAHLLYQLRKHEISVFIFQDRGAEAALPSGPLNAASFNMDSWVKNGLRYFVVGDVSAADIQALSTLLRDAS